MVARQATAIERGGLAAAEFIRDRAVKERNKSHAEASKGSAQLARAAAQSREDRSNNKPPTRPPTGVRRGELVVRARFFSSFVSAVLLIIYFVFHTLE